MRQNLQRLAAFLHGLFEPRSTPEATAETSPVLRRIGLVGIVAALIWGAYLRIEMYFLDRSLWVDPANLALNIINKDYRGLLGTLEGGQAAPVGFLFVSKVVGSLFDYSEMALIFFPFLMGLLALLLFLPLSVRTLEGAPQGREGLTSSGRSRRQAWATASPLFRASSGRSPRRSGCPRDRGPA